MPRATQRFLNTGIALPSIKQRCNTRLNETPLSNQQVITPLEGSDWSRIEAIVPDDTETLWWVFSLGENICVYEPSSWRDIIKQKIGQMQRLYAE